VAIKGGLCFLLCKTIKGSVLSVLRDFVSCVVFGFSASCYLQRAVVLGCGGERKVWALLERRTMMNGVEKTNGEDVATEEQLITPWTVSVAR
jgi:hypothetical protein